MSEKSAPAEGVPGTAEDQTGELKETIGSAGVHGDGKEREKPQSHATQDTARP